ncbi:MAG: glutaredoxin domain-containing protein [Tissierellia bacterium]|nr:glutaredoxin domain-containing protein [Tissierellia bacterium]
MKVYGAPICIDCVKSKNILDKLKADYKYIDITESTSNMREFLSLRDSRQEFDIIKKKGRIGIPAFVFTDGRIEFDIDDIKEEEIQADYKNELEIDDMPGLCGLDGC